MRGLNSDIQKAIDNQLLQVEQAGSNTLNLCIYFIMRIL